MEKLKHYFIKYKFLLIIGIMLSFLLMSIIYASTVSDKEEIIDDVNIIENKEQDETKAEEVKKSEKIKVDIKGYVKKEGVYELDVGSRVIDVINMAGGLIEGANTEYINLSKKIVDEMVIIIYSNSDVEKFKKVDNNANNQIIYVEYECICPDNENDACINESDTVNTNSSKNSNDEEESLVNDDGKISINLGTMEELMSLNGIGESKAKSIIKYREENGEFKKLEDIMNVSGIGESAYSKIKDNIKL